MFYIPKAIKAISLSGLIGAISVRQSHLFPGGFELNCALALFFFLLFFFFSLPLSIYSLACYQRRVRACIQIGRRTEKQTTPKQWPVETNRQEAAANSTKFPSLFAKKWLRQSGAAWIGNELALTVNVSFSLTGVIPQLHRNRGGLHHLGGAGPPSLPGICSAVPTAAPLPSEGCSPIKTPNPSPNTTANVTFDSTRRVFAGVCKQELAAKRVSANCQSPGAAGLNKYGG